MQAALDAVDAELAAHFSASGRRHTAADIDVVPPGWITGNNLQAALDELLGDLASTQGGSPGASRVGADAITGTPHALPAGNVDGQLSQLLGWLNAHVGASSGAHASSAIAYPGGPDWRGGRTNPATSVGAQLTKIINDLSAVDANDDGAERVGAQARSGAPLALPTGSVREQLNLLLGQVNRAGLLDESNEWSHPQTFAGTPGVRYSDPGGAMKLLLAVESGVTPLRIYFDSSDLWITINAEWDGAQWKASNSGRPRTAMRITEKTVEFLLQGTSANNWTTWERAVSLTLGGTNVEFVSSGATGIRQRAYTGAEGYHAGWSSIGGSWNYPMRFASPPTSVTFLQTSKWPSSWSPEPFLWQHDETGGSWVGNPDNGVATTAWYTAKVSAY